MVMDDEDVDFGDIPSDSEDEHLTDGSDNEAYRPEQDDMSDEEESASIDEPGPSHRPDW